MRAKCTKQGSASFHLWKKRNDCRARNRGKHRAGPLPLACTGATAAGSCRHLTNTDHTAAFPEQCAPLGLAHEAHQTPHPPDVALPALSALAAHGRYAGLCSPPPSGAQPHLQLRSPECGQAAQQSVSSASLPTHSSAGRGPRAQSQRRCSLTFQVQPNRASRTEHSPAGSRRPKPPVLCLWKKVCQTQ